MGEVGKRQPPVALKSPEPISSAHDLGSFDSGRPSLDQWLKERALRSEGYSARTYVVCAKDEVIAYYCLSTGAIARAAAPKRMARNMPDPIPVVLLGRLAVCRGFQGCGIGADLLRHAMARTLAISAAAGVRALLVHALDDAAAAFYRRYGFEPSPVHASTLMLPVETIRQAP